MVVNIGNRGNYKVVGIGKITFTEFSIIESKKEKWIKLISKLATGIHVALILFDTNSNTVLAGPPHNIDLAPLENGIMEVYWVMFRAFLYVSIPVYAWVGYVFGFAGSNSGKRTAAKITLFSLIGGNLFVAGAPWASKLVYSFCARIFDL